VENQTTRRPSAALPRQPAPGRGSQSPRASVIVKRSVVTPARRNSRSRWYATPSAPVPGRIAGESWTMRVIAWASSRANAALSCRDRVEPDVAMNGIHCAPGQGQQRRYQSPAGTDSPRGVRHGSEPGPRGRPMPPPWAATTARPEASPSGTVSWHGSGHREDTRYLKCATSRLAGPDGTGDDAESIDYLPQGTVT